ncbi:hypothetical protein BDQ17DRAFT_128569 [Cyathus striatus]|nr:hypothetical protein BDQ17DRAFT_128569 [Cyathus striatus]
MLAFETLLCTLALIRGFQTFKAKGPLFSSGRLLVGILIRDSVLYFLVICVTYLSCLLVWISSPISLLEVPIGFSVAMSCVLGNRIVLNVREVNEDIERSRGTHLSKPSMGRSNGRLSVHVSSRRDVLVDIVDVENAQGYSVTGSLSEYEMDTLRGMRADPRFSQPFVVL